MARAPAATRTSPLVALALGVLCCCTAFGGEPAPKAQPQPKAPAQPQPKAQPQPAPQKKDGPPSGDDIAAKAPTKTLEEAGLILSPVIAKNLRKALANSPKGADKHEVVFVGPGMATAEKDKLVPKPPEGWMFKVGPAGVTGADMSGLDMMRKLPDVLAKSRPGFVVLVGSLNRDKGGPTETQDWQDACAQCLRFGAIPVLGIPDAKDLAAPARYLFTTAATGANVPAYDLLNGGGGERISLLLRMLEQYVLSGAPGAKDLAVPADE